MAGMLMDLKDDGINDMSSPLQFQENVSMGCSFGPKLGSYDGSALMRPPELPTVILSPPEMTTTGGNRESSNDDTRCTPLTESSTKWVLLLVSANVYCGMLSALCELVKSSWFAQLRTRHKYAGAVPSEHGENATETVNCEIWCR